MKWKYSFKFISEVLKEWVRIWEVISDLTDLTMREAFYKKVVQMGSKSEAKQILLGLSCVGT